MNTNNNTNNNDQQAGRGASSGAPAAWKCSMRRSQNGATTLEFETAGNGQHDPLTIMPTLVSAVNLLSTEAFIGAPAATVAANQHGGGNDDGVLAPGGRVATTANHQQEHEDENQEPAVNEQGNAAVAGNDPHLEYSQDELDDLVSLGGMPN